jgi:hypothetical protein
MVPQRVFAQLMLFGKSLGRNAMGYIVSALKSGPVHIAVAARAHVEQLNIDGLSEKGASFI